MIWAYIIRFLFCAIPAAAIAVIPYYFEPDVGTGLFLIVFAFGWVITKPNPKRDESMMPNNRRFRA